VSDWDGYRDSVVDGETGFRVGTSWTRCDEDAIAATFLARDSLLDHRILAQSVVVDLAEYQQRIQLLIDRPALRRTMAVQSRRRAEQVFAWKRVIAQHEALWQELASRAKKEPRKSAASAHDRPAFFDVFAGHASRIVDAATRVGITPDGRAALE